MTDREKLEWAAKAVSYNPETGSIVWLKKSGKDAARWNSRYAGCECGTINDNGYRRILMRFQDQPVFRIYAHRLAWFIAHGKLPDQELDHINQNKLDNRLANLRDVSREINQRNGTRKGNNTSGFTGVTWHKESKKWHAQSSLNGKHKHLGLHNSITDAATAAREFRKANGFTETHGRQI